MAADDISTDIIRRPFPERMSLSELTQFVQDFVERYDRERREKAKAEKLASDERHHNFARLAGSVTAIQAEQSEFQRTTLASIAELRTAIMGNSLGARGLVQSVDELADSVKALSQVIKDDREASDRRHVETEKKLEPILAEKAVKPWYKSTIAMSVWCTLAGGTALSLVVYIAPAVGAILSGVK